MASILDRTTIRSKLYALIAGWVVLLGALGAFSINRPASVNAAAAEVSTNRLSATALREAHPIVAGLEATASSTGSAAAQALSAAGEPSHQSEVLNQDVGQFLTQVKAA